MTFVNAGPRQAGSAQRNPFASYADLLAWGIATGTLSRADATRLEAVAAERPGLASGVVRRARTLAGRLRRILLACAAGAIPDAADLEALNADLRAALAARQLIGVRGGCRWSWDAAGGDDLDRVLWPVLESASELLTAETVGKVRECAAEGCDLLFVARGGGKPRKWCSPACRNRETSSRHYQRRLKPARRERERQRRVEDAARRAGPGKRTRKPEPADEG